MFHLDHPFEKPVFELWFLASLFSLDLQVKTEVSLNEPTPFLGCTQFHLGFLFKQLF